MARPKEFEPEEALDAAITVFREHGFEGSSFQMLVEATGIGRQSLYDTFGDKWDLYRAAVLRYGLNEKAAHSEALHRHPRAIEGIEAMLLRVVDTAAHACLGVSSICEYGQSRPDLTDIHEKLGSALRQLIADRLRDGQSEGDVSADIDLFAGADFLVATITGIRVAGRAGADGKSLRNMAELALRSLR